MLFKRGFQLDAHCFASQAKPCNSRMEQTAGPWTGSTTIERPNRTSFVVRVVVIGEFVVVLRVVMGDARGAGAGASLTGRAMGLGFGRAGAGACTGFGLDGAGAWATRFFGRVGAGAGAGLAIFLKPGGFATGAFRAAGCFRAALAYGPSTYWPLGAAFSLSLPRRALALGAGLLVACGLAAPPACGLAPLAFGFTRAAVVGILILGRWLAADL